MLKKTEKFQREYRNKWTKDIKKLISCKYKCKLNGKKIDVSQIKSEITENVGVSVKIKKTSFVNVIREILAHVQMKMVNFWGVLLTIH